MPDEELTRFKTQIDLRQFLASEYGYIIDAKASWRGSRSCATVMETSWP